MSKQMSLSNFMTRKAADKPAALPRKPSDSIEVVTIEDYTFKPVSFGQNECIEISDDDRSPSKKSSTSTSLQNRHNDSWSEIESSFMHTDSNRNSKRKESSTTMDDIYAKYGKPDVSPKKSGGLSGRFDIDKELNNNPSYVQAMKKLDENLQQLDQTVTQFNKPSTGKFKFQPSKRNLSTVPASAVTPMTKTTPSSTTSSATFDKPAASFDMPRSLPKSSSISSLNNASSGFSASASTPIIKASTPLSTSTVSKPSAAFKPVDVSKPADKWLPSTSSSGSTDDFGSSGETRAPEKSSKFGFQSASDIMEKKTTGGSGFITPATEFIQSITTSNATATATTSTIKRNEAKNTRNSFNSDDAPEERRSSFESRLTKYVNLILILKTLKN